FLPMPVQHVELIPAAPTPVKSDIRFKGDDVKIFLYLKEQSGVRQLTRGDSASEGNLLQIAYVSRKRFGVIISIDGRGSVTLHFPATTKENTVLQQKGTAYLPNSYQLDDAPAFEKFFFIAADSPLNVPEIMAYARTCAKNPEKIHTDPLGYPGADEESFLLEKR
ncbi:MAG: ActD-like protein, partial [Spirochaetota bacterium]